MLSWWVLGGEIPWWWVLSLPSISHPSHTTKTKGNYPTETWQILDGPRLSDNPILTGITRCMDFFLRTLNVGYCKLMIMGECSFKNPCSHNGDQYFYLTCYYSFLALYFIPCHFPAIILCIYFLIMMLIKIPLHADIHPLDPPITRSQTTALTHPTILFYAFIPAIANGNTPHDALPDSTPNSNSIVNAVSS